MIGVVDYGAGNLASVTNALDFLGAPWRIVSTSADLEFLDSLVFPGVGAARPAMDRLRSSGLDQGLLEYLQSGRPYLGICLGMQLLFQHSAEDDSRCLGFLAGKVVRLTTYQKLPHVGWNTVDVTRPTPGLEGVDGAYFYFSHSYVVQPGNHGLISAVTDHGPAFVSAVTKGRILGVQFHPERSGRDGLRLLHQFCLSTVEKTQSNAG
ncbi:MAG: imidazole glycerol phosphate synthase subunit HisH [Candidatus Dormiibacterota bacterium]